MLFNLLKDSPSMILLYIYIFIYMHFIYLFDYLTFWFYILDFFKTEIKLSQLLLPSHCSI